MPLQCVAELLLEFAPLAMIDFVCGLILIFLPLLAWRSIDFGIMGVAHSCVCSEPSCQVVAPFSFTKCTVISIFPDSCTRLVAQRTRLNSCRPFSNAAQTAGAPSISVVLIEPLERSSQPLRHLYPTKSLIPRHAQSI